MGYTKDDWKNFLEDASCVSDIRNMLAYTGTEKGVKAQNCEICGLELREIEIEATCNSYENKEIEIIQDLYSPSKNIKFKCKNIRTMCDKHIARDVFKVNESIEILDNEANYRVCDVKVIPQLESENVSDGKIIYGGNLELNILYSSESGINSKIIKLPFEFNLEDNAVNSTYDVESKVKVLKKNFIVVNDNTMNSKIELEIEAIVSKNMQMSIIDEIEADERLEDNYSMVIYFVKSGETLWDIAKKFGSRIEDIIAVNDIENADIINEGQQLFIPRYQARAISR